MSLAHYIDVADHGAIGDGVADDTAAIQGAIQAASGGGGYKPVRFPLGKFKFTGLQLYDNVKLLGAGPFGGGAGTELIYAGGDNQDWISCGTAGNDWSNCRLSGLRIVKQTGLSLTSGYALRVFNPTNGARVEDLFVGGAPSGQIFVDNATGGSGNPGPNFFRLSNFFAVGGVTPVRIEGGMQQMLVDFGGIDLDSTSTSGLFASGGEGQAFTLNVQSVKIEGNYNIPGFLVSGISPVTFVGCSRYNNALNGTEAGFKYVQSGPFCQVICVGCTVKGSTTAFAAPDLSVTVPGTQSSGKYFNFITGRGFEFGPTAATGDHNKTLGLHQSCNFGWVDAAGTHDTFVRRAAAGKVNVGKLSVENSQAATIPGSVVKKLEVFDASGNSLGYVPVYDAIT